MDNVLDFEFEFLSRYFILSRNNNLGTDMDSNKEVWGIN